MINVEELNTHDVMASEKDARTSAKILLRQLQTITFVNKKITAVGIALASTDELLTEMGEKAINQTDVFTDVKENQDILSDSTSVLVEEWNRTINNLTTREEQLDMIEKIITTQNESTANYEKELSTLGQLLDKQSESVTDVQLTLGDLRARVIELDSTDKIESIKTQLTAYIDNLQKKQFEEMEAFDARFDIIDKVNMIIAHKLVEYEQLLKSYNNQIKILNLKIEDINERVNDLTPTTMNMSSETIIDMFQSLNAQTKAEQKQSADAVVETTNEHDVAGNGETENETTTMEIITVDPKNELMSNKNTETPKKKKSWKFWK